MLAITGAVAVVAVALVAVRANMLRNTPPKAEFPKKEASLGKVNAGDGIDLRFPVRNAGGKPLHILAVDRTCGCVSPQFPPVVQGRSTGEIAVRFEPLVTWSGHVEKELTVHTDDPGAPETKLKLLADILPLLQMEPQNPLQVMVKPGEVYHKEMSLIPRAGSHLKVTKVETDSPILHVELAPPAAGDKTEASHLKITVGPMTKSGDTIATIRLYTTDAKMSQTSVVVAALALEGPVINPREITFSGLDPGQKGKEITQLQVFTRSGEINVLGVDTGTPLLTAKVIPTTPNHMYSVSLRQAKEWKSGSRITSRIKVKTNDPKEPVLTVPFDVTVR
jgi:hypothetical protein